MRSVLGKWIVTSKVEKFHNREDFLAGSPYEVINMEGNKLLNEGINQLWKLVAGSYILGVEAPYTTDPAQYFGANCYIGVGNGTEADDSTLTGLTGTEFTYKKLDDEFPQAGTNQKITFKATYSEDEANHIWKEWSVANGNGGVEDTDLNIHTGNQTDIINLNRKREDMGEKYQGSTWVITVEIRLE